MHKPRYLQLDPLKDHEEIVKWMVVESWNFDLLRATELALLKTFSIPEISKILVDSGEFTGRSQKRIDDTDILLSLFIENGYSSPKGMKAIQKINRMHAQHPITNPQLLYVLATFVVEPIVWIDAYGWRPLFSIEKQALFHFWIAVGKRMGIRELFTDLEAMLSYHETFERERMFFSENNLRLYSGMIPYIVAMMPFPVGTMTKWALPAIMSPRLCAAFAVTEKSSASRSLVQSLLRLRGQVARLLPNRAHFRAEIARPSYPKGVKMENLGSGTP